MNTPNEERKSCENCRFFIQHYSKFKISYQKIHCGYCLKRTLTAKQQKHFPFLDGCEFWESIEIKKTERKELAIDYVQSIYERLNEIAEILKDDL